MGFVFGRAPGGNQERYWGISSPADLIPRRVTPGPGTLQVITDKSAMTISAIWAAVSIRSDLISTLPLSAYYLNPADEGQSRITAPLTPFLSAPAFMEFVYSSQSELDLTGNAIGIIKARYGNNYPADIELVPTSDVSLIIRKGELAKYRIGNVEYDPSEIYHEKQFTRAGLHVGLSPVAYSASQSSLYKTVQQFAMQWFMSGNGPRASLKNSNKKLSTKESSVVKEAWRASQSMGEPFVHGNDWEYNLVQAQAASNDWIESQKLSLEDVSRFFKVPADLLDAALSGSSITYANVLQRNLQFLVIHLGPAIRRRENALSQLLPRPRLVQLDADYLMRMDPKTLAEVIKTQIEARAITPNEARSIYNRKPLTDAQYKEYELSGLNKTATGALTGAEELPTPAGTQTEPVDANAASPADNGNTPKKDQGSKANG